ncbi:MAG: small multi-drug export protein [Clostridia bacterium]|nr:small multi-drug export protein [Clostridia bacterium]MBQ4396602.1 small multi-drug export protein [Clostridia bacterium]
MIETIQTFFQENFPPQLAVFFISMIPLIECRGAIPFGMVVLQMPMWEVLPIAIAGNILPVPFILLLIRPVIAWLKTTKLFHPLAEWIERKADKKKDQVLKYSKWGLFAFVAIPIPGTGAWTGALIAALLEMKVKSAFFTILFGMICAALIMTLGSMIVDGLISGQWPEELQMLGDFLAGIRDYVMSLLSDHSVTVS